MDAEFWSPVPGWEDEKQPIEIAYCLGSGGHITWYYGPLYVNTPTVSQCWMCRYPPNTKKETTK